MSTALRVILRYCLVTLGFLVLGIAATATAQPVRFDGIDAGAAPGSPRPNSDAAAAAFDAAASGLAPLEIIDSEVLALGNFSTLEIAPGVTAILTGTDSSGGIVADGVGIWGTTILGYNTTAAGQQFIGFAPLFNIGTASLELLFDEPIQAFGTYVTGLGTANGNLFVEFDDGSMQSLPVAGAPSGGVLFFGFTDAGAAIVRVVLELSNVFGSRDIFGVDDLRFVSANTPPVASCMESVNPSGKNTPPAGSTTLPGSKGGQNEDGFYELIGEDEQDGTAPVFVTNASGSATFGPFSSGSVVKITEAPGRTPTAKSMGGPNSAVAAHITLDSDAFVFAVDSFGEESPVVSCLVPPPPK